MKKVLIVLCVCLFLCGCSGKLTTEEIEKIMSENEYIIIDVRTNEEYSESHIVEAINIPYDEIESNLPEKDKVIFLYCQSGKRSQIAFNTLSDLGYTVYDLGSFSDIDLDKE